MLVFLACSKNVWQAQTQTKHKDRTIPLLWRLTLLRTRAISKVPVVSMLAAMTGMPVYVCLELRNVKVLWRST